jgi:protein-S-isoprenylcysteine O-methyltransferase Ste14
MNDQKSLRTRAARRLGKTLAVLTLMVFVPAGSLRFWQGWLFLALLSGFWILFFVDLMKRDPQLVERRLQNEEREPQQKLFQKLFILILFAFFILSGLDFRFGWSRERLRPVPLALVLAAQVFVVAGYTLVFWVMKTNTFAASTIQVEAEHRVIHTGPYAFVRHPMYTGMTMALLGTPLALGSYIALPVFALLVPLLVYRLIHEERVLRRDLPGYLEYCEQTRFRLVPWLW